MELWKAWIHSCAHSPCLHLSLKRVSRCPFSVRAVSHAVHQCLVLRARPLSERDMSRPVTLRTRCSHDAATPQHYIFLESSVNSDGFNIFMNSGYKCLPLYCSLWFIMHVLCRPWPSYLLKLSDSNSSMCKWKRMLIFFTTNLTENIPSSSEVTLFINNYIVEYF